MPKSAMIRARVEPKLKSDVEKLFKKLGISSSQAIGMFYSQVKLRKGLPFDVRIPNETTVKTFEQSDKGINVKTFKSEKELFKDLEIT